MRKALVATLLVVCAALLSCVDSEPSPRLARFDAVTDNAQEAYFSSLAADEQVALYLDSLDRPRSRDLRLLLWLASSERNVEREVLARIQVESDDWRLVSLALALEHFALPYSCKVSGPAVLEELERLRPRLTDKAASEMVDRVLNTVDPAKCPRANS